MTSPTTRVLAVLELLQAHNRMSGMELAARVGVDERTLRRYIGKLDDLGIPVTSSRGRYGHYSLVAGFKLPPLMFTDDEALAIAVGLLASRSLGLGEATAAVESAQAKLERVLPAQLRLRLRALSETVTLDLRASPSAHDNATLVTLSTAAHQHRRVRLRYRTPRHDDQATGFRTSEREVDPYGLAWRAQQWYVVGWCHLRRELRSFRVDRIAEVELLGGCDNHFAAPQAFDAMAYLAHSVSTLPRATSVVVLLKTDLKRAREELFEAIGVFQPDPDGDGVLLHGQADDLDWYARQLARLSFAFEVKSPPALRDALRKHAQRLLAAATEAM